jgi:hypothetical protein
VDAFMDWARAHASLVTAVGGIIVFFSWVVTNTISNRLAATRSAVDRTTADDMVQRLDRLRRGYREIKAVVSRLDILMSELNPTSSFSSLGHDPTTNARLRETAALLQTAQTSFFEHEDLQELVHAVDRLASTQELPAPLRTRLTKVPLCDRHIACYRRQHAGWQILTQMPLSPRQDSTSGTTSRINRSS